MRHKKEHRRVQSPSWRDGLYNHCLLYTSYRGLTKIDTPQGLREVISLEFDDGVTLHVPLQESHLCLLYTSFRR